METSPCVDIHPLIYSGFSVDLYALLAPDRVTETSLMTASDFIIVGEIFFFATPSADAAVLKCQRADIYLVLMTRHGKSCVM